MTPPAFNYGRYIADCIAIIAVVIGVVLLAAVLTGCTPEKAEGEPVCLVPEPQNRPYCGNPVDIDRLEELRQELGAECVALCCEKPEQDFVRCGPRQWPDGGSV